MRVDPTYMRPTEVDALLGDASKARKTFGWVPSTSFADLVKEMVATDIALIRGKEPIPVRPFCPDGVATGWPGKRRDQRQGVRCQTIHREERDSPPSFRRSKETRARRLHAETLLPVFALIRIVLRRFSAAFRQRGAISAETKRSGIGIYPPMRSTRYLRVYGTR